MKISLHFVIYAHPFFNQFLGNNNTISLYTSQLFLISGNGLNSTNKTPATMEACFYIWDRNMKELLNLVNCASTQG